MEISRSHVEAYLTRLLGNNVQVLSLESLMDSQGASATEDDASQQTRRKSSSQPLKTYGYGQPLLVCYQVAGDERRAVLRTIKPNPFGYECRADRAADILSAYDTFNHLSRHTRALDIGVLTSDLHLRSLSLDDRDEFFMLTNYVEGEPYAWNLQRLYNTGQLTDLDIRRAQCLAEYLAEIHAVKHDNPPLYRRRVRDLIGGGQGIMGLIDNYPPGFSLIDVDRLEQFEQTCVSWRWRLKERTHRLSQVHGDFHRFNVLFGDDVDLGLIDRRGGEWGEPGDDVSSMTIDYLLFSLQRSEMLAPPFETLWKTFWDIYLDLTCDQEVLTVVAPFFAWRALVLASPVWTKISDAVRKALFQFIENVLREDAFDPARVNDYIR